MNNSHPDSCHSLYSGGDESWWFSPWLLAECGFRTCSICQLIGWNLPLMGELRDQSIWVHPFASLLDLHAWNAEQLVLVWMGRRSVYDSFWSSGALPHLLVWLHWMGMVAFSLTGPVWFSISLTPSWTADCIHLPWASLGPWAQACRPCTWLPGRTLSGCCGESNLCNLYQDTSTRN